MRIHPVVLSLTLVLAACGSPASPDSSGSSGDDAPAASERCEGYSLGDSCVDEDNLAACRRMAEQCPGQVQVMESCPLQFACPSASAEAETCGGFSPTDACMDEDNFAQCREMEARCPGAVSIRESCPMQFACP